ncbi:MAG: hypothetical protein Q4E28_02435 [Clostridia bacterium]|nr:hypothetical protein [Clostridia bacterium]
MKKKMPIVIIILLIIFIIAQNIYLIYQNKYSEKAFINNINNEMLLGLNSKELEKKETLSFEKGPRGEGMDVSIYKVKDDTQLRAFMKKGPNKTLENEVENIFTKVKYSNATIFKNEYSYYVIKKDNDFNNYYLIYSHTEKQLYIIRDLR